MSVSLDFWRWVQRQWLRLTAFYRQSWRKTDDNDT
jgi:hypothetical protein